MSTIYKPLKRKYAIEDSFFEQGNIALRALRLKKQATDDFEKEIIQQEEVALTVEKREPIYCDSCTSYFGSIQLYEAHYEAQHRNVCLECLKVFPAFRWLQLHLDEVHDILKQLKKERGEKIFACFVEGCTKHFSSPKKRKLHLIDKHHYSKHFPFDITLTGSLSFEQRKRRVQRKKRLASEHHENRNDGNSTKDVGMDELVSNMSKLRIPKSISFGHAKPSIQRHGYNTRSATKDVNMTQQDDKKRPYSRKKRETMGVDRA